MSKDSENLWIYDINKFIFLYFEILKFITIINYLVKNFCVKNNSYSIFLNKKSTILFFLIKNIMKVRFINVFLIISFIDY